ncbi:Gfo/Idh/MocA family oxidoreductase [Nocardia sp. NPDC003979]
MTDPLRLLVCGTTFGQVYLDAIASDPESFALAGVLASGSVRSRRIADERGVPLYTAVDQLPADIDAACVVVRSGLLGGPGTRLAEALLEREVHVLQEHPVHHDELAGCLRLARKHGVQYRLNTFYEHLEPIRRFRGAAAELLQRHKPLFIDAAAGFPVAFGLLDLIGGLLGGVRPWWFGPLATPPEPHTGRPGLRVLSGAIAGVPVSLRIQHQLDPVHPDNPAELLHGLSLTVEGGTLHLVTTHGPTVWASRPRLPAAAAPGIPCAADPPAATAVLGPDRTPSFSDCVVTLWPEAVRHALHDLRAAVVEEHDVMRRGRYHLSLCQAWQDLAKRLGPPELVSLDPGAELTATDLRAVFDAGTGQP